MYKHTVQHLSQGVISAQLEVCGESDPMLAPKERCLLYQTERSIIININFWITLSIQFKLTCFGDKEMAVMNLASVIYSMR